MVRFGVGKMRAIASVIHKLCPELELLCKMLETNFLIPMINGRALLIGQIKVSRKESLTGRV
jgi:hypothetical protein